MDYKKLIDGIFSAYKNQGEKYMLSVKTQEGFFIRKSISELNNS